VHETWREFGAGEVGWIRVDRGWKGLADRIGLTSNKAPNELHDLFNVLAHTTIRWASVTGLEGGTDNLGGFRWEQPAPNRPAVLYLRPSPLLSTDLVQRMTKGDRDRVLVPVLPLPPVGFLGPRLQAAACRLDWLAMCELAKRANEIVENKGVELEWEALAAEAEMPLVHLDRVLQRWTSDGKDGPKRWAQPVPNRWNLAEVEETSGARKMLEQRGHMQVGGQVLGKRGADKKRKRLLEASARKLKDRG
jgi:hypothetical protein